MRRKGFTLIELLVVVAIIGILSAVGMVMFGGQTEKAKIAVSKTNYKSIISLINNKLAMCAFETSIKLKKRDGTDNIVSCNKGTHDMAWDFGDHLRAAGVKNPYSGKPDIWLGGVPLKTGEMQITGWSDSTSWFPPGESCPNNKPCFHIEVMLDDDSKNNLKTIIVDPRY